jgi:hypothetical protein
VCICAFPILSRSEYEAIREFLTGGAPTRDVIAREIRAEPHPADAAAGGAASDAVNQAAADIAGEMATGETETATGEAHVDPSAADPIPDASADPIPDPSADPITDPAADPIPDASATPAADTARTRMELITAMIHTIQVKIDALPASVRPGIVRTLLQDIRHSFEQRVPRSLRAETRATRLDTLPSLALALVAIERHLSSEEQWLLARMVETGVLPTDERLAAKARHGGVPLLDEDTVNVMMAATGTEVRVQARFGGPVFLFFDHHYNHQGIVCSKNYIFQPPTVWRC